MKDEMDWHFGWFHRLSDFWDENGWRLLLLFWLVLFTLGVAGFTRHAAWHNRPGSLLDSAYLTLQLIPMNSGAVAPPVPWQLELARFGIPLLATVTAVKALLLVFRQQVDRLRLRSLRGHVVICGLSRKGFHLMDSFRQRNRAVVVIEKDDGNDWLEECRARGAIVLVGDATDALMLRQAGVLRARCLMAVCDDDSVNAEILLQTRRLVDQSPGDPLVGLGHLVDPQLCALLRTCLSNLEAASFRLEFFNVFERGARLLLQELPPFSTGAESPPQLLVVGLGRMGESLVVHAARDWWNRLLENRSDRETQRIKVFALDQQANVKIRTLYARYPQLAQACELIPLEMGLRSPEFLQGDYLAGMAGGSALSAAYVCLDDDSLGLQTGLELRKNLASIPIAIRMAEENGLAHLLVNCDRRENEYDSLYVFALLNRTCSPNLLLSTPYELLARAIHEDFVRQERAAGRYGPTRPTLKEWDALDPVHRQENYHRVDRIQRELTAVDCKISPLVDWNAPSWEFSPQEVEQMAQLEHSLWCAEKESQGWRFAPGQRDDPAQTHPDLVSWETLPPAEQEKNRQMVRAIPHLLARCGFQVTRLLIKI
ncbi:MAG: NAD-binding protein [Anaerolineales bacterium]|nr:NAD-binding protein [Anaerolineales bacterium]